jgi:hypothetical protein
MTQDDASSLGTAAAAQKLYNPDTIGNKGNGAGAGTVNADGTINGDPAASVTTYIVGYGSGADKTHLDWMAWGGSGMRRAFGTYSGQDTWTTIPTQAERDACKTCIDSFLAPDPDTLSSVLTKVINQGASSGEFSAQQSLTDSIYELAGDARRERPRRPGARSTRATATTPLCRTGSCRRSRCRSSPGRSRRTRTTAGLDDEHRRNVSRRNRLPPLERQRQARLALGERHVGGLPLERDGRHHR